MTTFTVVLVSLLGLACLAALIALAFGVGFLVEFSDWIVGGLIVAFIVKLFNRSK